MDRSHNFSVLIRHMSAQSVVITGMRTGANRMNLSPITGGRLTLDLAAGDNRWGDQTVGTDACLERNEDHDVRPFPK